jgi:MYXO-CTERM domain-containing protein
MPLVLASLAGSAVAEAASVCGDLPDVMIVLDRSGSMSETNDSGDTKWSIAKTAIGALTADFAGSMRFGFSLFPRWPHVSNCSTGQINVAPSATSVSAISSLLNSTYPDGDTPSTSTLNTVRSYLQGIKSSGKAQYVILITDGKETCSPYWPDSATGPLYGSDGVKTFVVGFGDDVLPDRLNDAASSGGTGSYYQADNLSQLKAALQGIAGQISCCGNGTLDPGELCDTAIVPGFSGACPTNCDDNNPCTTDKLVGGACGGTCQSTPITTMVNGDGCCPAGATSATDSDCSPTCGDGVKNAGETCDTAIPQGQYGACPLSCNDGDPCTVDAMVGSGCAAYCTHVNTCPSTQCGNGIVESGEKCDTGIASGTPGACPTSDKQCDDGDPATKDYLVGQGCSASCKNEKLVPQGYCGDGAVGQGELCDTAIVPGQPGACPFDCNDKNPCTNDSYTGSACTIQCVNTPITAAVNGDGCCAPGATSATDSDCPTTCGNGVLDPGETCDPGITIGPGTCLTACDDGDSCTVDSLGGSGCDVKCVSTPVAPSATPDGCCPTGVTQAQDPDCLPPCDPDQTEPCADPCAHVTCADGMYCRTGQCIPWPVSQTDDGAKSPGPSDVKGGCDCEVAGGGASAGGLLTLFLAAVFALARRRRP